jgi:hypothetical protein
MSIGIRQCWFLAGCVVLSACSGAQLAVRVWGLKYPLPDMQVTIADTKSRACHEYWFASAVTDTNGLARLATEWCGEQQLLVSGPGMRTYRQAIDTCSFKFLNVTLKPSRRPRVASGPCAQAAHSFIEALLRHDYTQLREVLADPERVASAERNTKYLTPWAIDVESSIGSASCQVVIGLLLETGCSSRWQVDVQQRDDVWIVRGFEPLPDRDLSE